MTDEPLPLKEADAVEITTVLDNTCDMLLPSSATVRRASLGTRVGRKVLRAEHGFAAVIKVSGGGTSESLLFDAGLSRDGLMHNLDVLELKPNEMHATRSATATSTTPTGSAGCCGASAGAACRCCFIPTPCSSARSYCPTVTR